jgi:LacI family transcriptional regulator
VEGDFRIEGGFSAMQKILDQPEIPTAVVTANDLTAIGCLRAAYQRGVRVPDDLSIVGCDDIALSDIVLPPLTTLRISRREYAELLFKALRECGEELARPGRQYALSTKLVVRSSTGPAPRAKSSTRSAGRPDQG